MTNEFWNTIGEQNERLKQAKTEQQMERAIGPKTFTVWGTATIRIAYQVEATSEQEAIAKVVGDPNDPDLLPEIEAGSIELTSEPDAEEL